MRAGEAHRAGTKVERIAVGEEGVAHVETDAASARLDTGALLDNLRDCVVFQLLMIPDGPDGEMRRRLSYVSPSIEPLFGLTRADAIADVMNWYRLIEPSEVERITRAEAEATRTLSRFSVEASYNILGQRRVFSVTSSPTLLAGGTIQWDGVAMDVTDRIEAQALRERLAAVIEASEDYASIQTVMPDGGTCIYLNAAGRALRGLPDDVDPTSITMESRHPPDEVARIRGEILPEVMRYGRWSGPLRLLHADGTEIPTEATILAHRDRTGDVAYLSVIVRDQRERLATESALRDANEQTEVALREVNHRVKNLFALVPALVTLSARGKSDVGEVVEAVQDRVMALARSHAITINAFSQDKGVVLDALIRAVLEPYQNRADAFSLDGPPVRLSSSDGNAMALTLHELATNAAKYGALFAPRGRVSIAWRVDDVSDEGGEERRLHFTWTERGGPPVAEPSESGFGTRLIDRMIRQQAGEVERDWAREGVRVRVMLPLHVYGAGSEFPTG